MFQPLEKSFCTQRGNNTKITLISFSGTLFFVCVCVSFAFSRLVCMCSYSVCYLLYKLWITTEFLIRTLNWNWVSLFPLCHHWVSEYVIWTIRAVNMFSFFALSSACPMLIWFFGCCSSLQHSLLPYNLSFAYFFSVFVNFLYYFLPINTKMRQSFATFFPISNFVWYFGAFFFGAHSSCYFLHSQIFRYCSMISRFFSYFFFVWCSSLLFSPPLHLVAR